MNEYYENLSSEAEYSINFLDVDCPQLIVPWHFHSEAEIIHIEKGRGIRFVGDHSESFQEGDIGLIGSNLSHEWRSDATYKENIPGLTAHVQVVHFHESIFNGPLAILPEMHSVNQLLIEAQLGIKFFGLAREHIEIQMRKFIKTTGIEKLLKLIEILDFMSRTDEKELLSSTGYSKIKKCEDYDRFDKALRYIIDNFKENISIETVSAMIGMTPTSFCRYFKKHTNKSFLTVLTEIRIGHACKLLIGDKMNISGICYESGFRNISNFNEQFKKIKGISPSQYIKIRQKSS